MRRRRPLDVLLTRTKQEILAATLLHPERAWYLTDLARHLGRRPSSLQRDLAGLVEAGILSRSREAGHVYFKANTESPFIAELRSLLIKSAGLADVIRDALDSFKHRIVCAFIYGSIARSSEVSSSDVDLIVIGRVGLAELSPFLATAERTIGRPINALVYSLAEWRRKTSVRSHFLEAILREPKIFLVGSEDELGKATQRRTRRAPQEQ